MLYYECYVKKEEIIFLFEIFEDIFILEIEGCKLSVVLFIYGKMKIIIVNCYC